MPGSVVLWFCTLMGTAASNREIGKNQIFVENFNAILLAMFIFTLSNSIATTGPKKDDIYFISFPLKYYLDSLKSLKPRDKRA